MIDYKLLTKKFDEVSEKLRTRNISQEQIEALKNIYKEYKDTKQQVEQLQAQQNNDSKLFKQYIQEKKDISELRERVNANKKQISLLKEKLSQIESQFEKHLFSIPNIPDDDVPIGADESSNVVIENILTPREFDFEPKPHYELGEQLGWLDFERGVKLAKSRFTLVNGLGARLERALINFMLDHNREHGFEEVSVPILTNRSALFGTGQLPKFEDDLFKIEGEELYLIPTAEVSLTNIYANEILRAEELPKLFTSATPCFRKEAGSGGKDIRGIIRQHQFYKVELVAITKPEQSDEVFDKMIETASSMLKKLGLPHRKVLLSTGDMGFSAAKTVDLEVWLPSQKRYREISSISNTRDFQARRAKIRYKEKKKNILVHTLNGSSLAVGRTMVAIIENYQQKDGTIQIPEILKRYM